MAEMIQPRSLPVRVLATLLPVCFVWVFVACASLCAMHGETERETRAAAIFDSADAPDDFECCALEQALASVLPDRQSSLTRASSYLKAAFLPAVLTTGNAPSSRARRETPRSTSDPPLKRLCTLRI